ncbi:MAG: hypothetical protein KC620_09560 [Myxococcales bacterium]|nr:hypothetical protein [Myxococcales bacterium]
MTDPAPTPESAPTDEDPPEDRRRLIAGLCAFAFFLLGGYGLARPSIESLYIATYTSRALPYAWLGVAVAAALATAVYGRFAARVELTRLFGGAIGVVAALLALLLLALRLQVPGAAYLLYLWKDVYIVVLVEIFWTIANTHFQLKRATWLYGFFCACGAAGGAISNFFIGDIALAIGTNQAPLLLFPLFVVLYFITRALPETHRQSSDKPRADLAAGFEVLLKSRYLMLLLGVIAIIQIVTALIDYQFNTIVEAAWPDKDARTDIVGTVYFAIEISSFTLQITTGIIVALLGVRGTLLSIPLILGAALAAFLAAPVFLWMAVAKVANKALDYSLFRAAKEMLYLPLDYSEKTQGKAVVDMLTYRAAKAGASVLILGFEALAAPPLTAAAIAIGLVALWIGLIVAILRRYRTRSGA